MFGPIVVKPGASKSNKTGSWRTNLRPEFSKKDCSGCKLCALVCPESCISGDKKENIICDLAYCKGCGLCAIICPKKDIQMVPEGKKK